MAKKPNKIKRMSILNLTEEDVERLGLIDAQDSPGWWIKDPNNPPCTWVGPYDTKKDAQEAKRGLERTWRAWDVE